jgi:ribosomal protein L11 methyltransferase
MPLLSDPRDLRRNSFAESDIRGYILGRIGGRRLAPVDLLMDLARYLNLSRDQTQAIVRELVAAGELAYIFEHGRTFLEPSFDRPVRVSGRIVLAPPERAFNAAPTDVVIWIMPGAAFGAGRHPTTRLALRGVEFTLTCWEKPLGGPGRRVLDIGTGTGVLAIAAVMLGMVNGLGIDIDPCAVAEARANVELNNLSGRIAVSDRNAEAIDGAYELVTANLRTPTLAQLAPWFAKITAPQGALVISGFRCEECDGLLCVFENLGFTARWRGEEQRWVGLALTKNGGHHQDARRL